MKKDLSPARQIVEQFFSDRPRCYSPHDMYHAVKKDIEEGNVSEAFRLTYNLFKCLWVEAPSYIGDRFKEAWENQSSRMDQALQLGYESDQTGLLIEFAAQNPDFENPALVDMTKMALSWDELVNRLVGGSLNLYYQHFHEKNPDLEKGYEPDHALTSMDYYKEGSPEFTFKDRVKALWTLAETGRFSEALDTLAPLVNFLFEQEGKGVFPLGIGVSGQNMSATRYGRDGSGFNEFEWLKDESLKNAINVAITAAEDQNRFRCPDASLTARNMFAMMCRNSGVSYHLPADLAWLMKGVENVEQRLPVTRRHPEYPEYPWDYVPDKKLVLDFC